MLAGGAGGSGGQDGLGASRASSLQDDDMLLLLQQSPGRGSKGAGKEGSEGQIKQEADIVSSGRRSSGKAVSARLMLLCVRHDSKW